MQIVEEEKKEIEKPIEIKVTEVKPVEKSIPNFTAIPVRVKEKSKGRWALKIPILVYLVLMYSCVYISGKALGLYMNNSVIAYYAVIIHTVFVVLFLMLSFMKEKNGKQ